MTPHKGWHSRGYLPHFDSPDIAQFVTFWLADSLPPSVIEALSAEDDAMLSLDRELDVGLGACWLRNPEIAAMVQETLLHFDAERYRLLAWCVMPNHVHVVVEVLDRHSLGTIVKSWKSFTSRQANTHLGRTGSFWEADYFDRYMRNEQHLLRTIEYVEHNPVKAGLADEPAAWPWSSAAARRSADPEQGGVRTSRSARES